MREQMNNRGTQAEVDPKGKPFSGLGKPEEGTSLNGITLANFHSQSEHLGDGKFSLGIYMFKWKSHKDGVIISLDGVSWQMIHTLLILLGYRKWYTGNNYEFVCVLNNIMDPVTPDIMKSHILRIAEAEDGPLSVEYMGGEATFSRPTLLEVLRRHVNSILNKSFFEQLPRHNIPLLRDTKDTAYFPFINGILRVTAANITLIPYSSLNNITLWRSHIIKRSFTWNDPTLENCAVMALINNLTSHDQARRQSLCSAIGYIIHNYNHSSRGVAFMLYDEKPTKKGSGNGGTGKGLICQIIGLVREVVIIDGKSFNRDERFSLQCVNTTTQVIVFDDIKAGSEFSPYYSLITEGVTIEKKNEQAVKISAKESPKIIITSNNIVGGSGTSDIRRQFIVELSDYYSSRIKPGGISPVEQEHGVLFDDDTWSLDEWNAFYCFVAQCAQLYLTRGLTPYQFKNIAKNRVLQHCGEDFTNWVYQQNLTVGHEYNLTNMYIEYVDLYYGGNNTKFPYKTFSNHIKTFGEVHGWTYEPRRSNHVNYGTYRFGSNGDVGSEVAESGLEETPF